MIPEAIMYLILSVQMLIPKFSNWLRLLPDPGICHILVRQHLVIACIEHHMGREL